MSETPQVSILMGVYNEERFLEDAIESILGQTYQHFEFIVVDDDSTDDSRSIARSFDDPRITLLENDENRGLTASLNRALEAATGTYVARQDADDCSEPDRLARQVAFLEEHEEVAVVGSGAYLIDHAGTVIDRRVGYCRPKFDEFLEKSHLVHGSILARHTVLEELDGYDEFFRYGQDYDLWLRLSKRYPVANVSDPLYRLRVHDDSVYFSRKDESVLYSMLARHLSTGEADEAVKDRLSTDGITEYYDQLDRTQRKVFHHDLATRYLRYGHAGAALKECRKARRFGRTAPKTVLLTLLGKAGPEATRAVRWGMRRYLNAKTTILNRLNCPYRPTEPENRPRVTVE